MTRYSGRIAATISDDTSVMRLTVPSAKTLPLSPFQFAVLGLSSVDKYTSASSGLAASVAVGGAAVGVGLAGLGDELPVEAVAVQRELQHAAGAGVAGLAVRLDRAEAVGAGTAHARDELTDAARVVQP